MPAPTGRTAMATRGGAIRRMGSSLNDRELDELVPAYNNLLR